MKLKKDKNVCKKSTTQFFSHQYNELKYEWTLVLLMTQQSGALKYEVKKKKLKKRQGKKKKNYSTAKST